MRPTFYVGIDWSEIHRFDRLRARMADSGWTYAAPMCDPPWKQKDVMLSDLRACGIAPPRLYTLGFSHNNCGGFCIKAGKGHFANLLRTMPDRYRHHEGEEAGIRARQGEHAYILKDTAGGESTPLTLRGLRERIERGGEIDMFDIGGCGCFVDVVEP